MDDNFLKVAKQAALEAGAIISKYIGGKHTFKIKNQDNSDFATQADLEAEKKIVRILNKNFPSHNIIAEERGTMNKGSEYTWVIDPLDGTFSFSVGMPFFSVSIGLLKNKEPFLGVIYHISAKDLYWAQEGKGAYLNQQKIQVSKRNSLEMSAFCLDPGHINRRKRKYDRYIEPLFNKVAAPYEIGSAAASLAYLGKGIFDGVINDAWIWDFSAGVVIVREAGGRVTDFEGNEPDWSKERLEIVASNGLIHDQILEALKK